MSKYKVSVYAICKNEEKFVARWMKSMGEADEIYVLDTGSTDDTVKKLRKLGAKVKVKKIIPWRFDEARNMSLSMVSNDTDICICTDLDEVFVSGWREKLEEVWERDTARLQYNYNWSFDRYGNPAVNFYISKTHARNGYQWTHPVHEVLTYLNGKERVLTTDEITVNHYPDDTKSRGSYLPLLELSVKEDPEDDRNMHYLGREYMFYEKWNDCIDTLIKHLSLPRATWKDERSASMRFIARSYKALKRFEEARMWYLKAIDEAPYLREPYVECGILEYELKEYGRACPFLKSALKIDKNEKSYINEPNCYNGTVEDILSICFLYTGYVEEAIHYAKIAQEKFPEDERILNNIKFMEAELNQEKEEKK